MRSKRWIADCIAAIREAKAPLLLTMLCLSPTVVCSTYASVHVVSTARSSNRSSGGACNSGLAGGIFFSPWTNLRLGFERSDEWSCCCFLRIQPWAIYYMEASTRTLSHKHILYYSLMQVGKSFMQVRDLSNVHWLRFQDWENDIIMKWQWEI